MATGNYGAFNFTSLFLGFALLTRDGDLPRTDLSRDFEAYAGLSYVAMTAAGAVLLPALLKSCSGHALDLVAFSVLQCCLLRRVGFGGYSFQFH